MRRALIVNADDLGRSAAITDGALDAHARGIVTSASLMVRWAAAEEAAERVREHPELSVGLHLDLGEWAFDSGEWLPTYEVVDLEDGAAVEREVRAQVERFRALTGRDPSHLDSHQHVHTRPGPVARAARAAAAALGVPLRGADDRVAYRGDFYGRTATGEPSPAAIGVDALLSIVEELGQGVTELGCHPGSEATDDRLYGAERAREVAALTDPRVREALDRGRIELVSFASLGAG